MASSRKTRRERRASRRLNKATRKAAGTATRWRGEVERLEPRLLLTATARDGIPYIDLGPSDNIAWDQPRVTVELLTDAAGTGSIGPQVFNSQLLDTGANTTIMMATAVREMSDPPFPYATDGKFEEIGVAGTQIFDISASYRFDFAGKDGVRNTLLDSRIISDPDNDFSQFGPWGVIGMPTMVDRVTTLDYTVWETVQGLDLFMGVEFRDDLPESNGGRYTIDVDKRLEFEPEPHVIEGCCPPLWGDVPFLTAFPMHNGVSAGGDFLFDTGAQVSVLSVGTALQLGLDSNDDGVLDENDANFARFEAVGGIGGATTVPVFLFDAVHIPTQSGVDLVWTDLQWLVLDIVPGLDGVLGSDLMTSGWLEGFATAGKSGWLDQIQLDFRQMNVNGTSEIHFDLNEQVNRIIDPNGAGAQVIESGGHTTVSETGVDDQYEIALTQQPTANVTVTLSSPDGELTAVDDANPSNPFLTFTAANWHVPQSVRVSAVDDLEEEAFHRASVFHISSSTDPVYQDAGMPRVIVNIFDDEFGGVVTIPSDGSTDVVEGGAGDTYDIVLTMQPTQEVTISLETVGNQVTVVDDARPSNGYLVFTPSNWNVPQPVRVTAVDDFLAEGIHEAYINHSIVTDATEYQEAFALQELVTIADNDAGGIVINPTNGLTTTEGSGQATFTVALQTPPNATVEIGLSSNDPSEGTVFPTQVIFTTTNWTTPQVVTVTGVNDDQVDGDIGYKIETAPAISTDPVFTGMNPDDVDVINVDDDVDGLSVIALIPTNNGFILLFNNDVDVAALTLHDTQSGGLGPEDVTLQGATTGRASGSFVVDPSLRTATFIKTDGTLDPDTYTVTLRSANDGFKTVTGALLDGDGNGAVGDDFIASYPVSAAAPGTVTVGVPNIVRGPGQDVNLPADSLAGIPLSISDGTGVRNVSLQISYNSAFLDITAASVASVMPAGSTVSLNRPIPGFAIITFTSPTDLPAGRNTFVNLRADVPAVNANGNYNSQHLLDVQGITVSGASGSPLAVIDNDAVHHVAYFGDASGNGRVNASDASLLARVAALLDSGFSASPLTDPSILGDISGNNRLNAADASLVAQAAALIPVSEIPPIPGGLVTNPGGTALGQNTVGQTEVGKNPATSLGITAARYGILGRPLIDQWLDNYTGEEEQTPADPVDESWPGTAAVTGDITRLFGEMNRETTPANSAVVDSAVKIDPPADFTRPLDAATHSTFVDRLMEELGAADEAPSLVDLQLGSGLEG